jgi:uncharacterized RDD family membrane protein YckC
MEYQEYVAYEKTLAKRIFAALIDYGLFIGILFVYAHLFGEINADGTRSVHGYGNLFLVFLFWVILIPGIEGFFGYTLGKGLLDLKVVCENKQETPLIASLKRHIVDFIDFFLFGAVAIILVKTSNDHNRLGDRLAHTHVIVDK